MATKTQLELTPEELAECGRRAKEHTFAGAGLGAATVASLAILGVSCPLCVVAAPALIGSGAWNAHKKRKAERAKEPAPPEINFSRLEPTHD